LRGLGTHAGSCLQAPAVFHSNMSISVCAGQLAGESLSDSPMFADVCWCLLLFVFHLLNETRWSPYVGWILRAAVPPAALSGCGGRCFGRGRRSRPHLGFGLGLCLREVE